MTISICAVIAARNEAPYLRILLPVLANQGIDVVILDNDSDDQSHEIYATYSPHPIIHVENLPFNGEHSLENALSAKQQIYSSITHDWVIHHDADEILEHYKEGSTLRDAIQEADDAGYNVINFEEFVFLPRADEDYRDKNYYQNITRYYYFKPLPTPRLQRAWKRSGFLRNINSGGHSLSGDNANIFPTNHVLRHYIVLGQEHARKKYLNRTFTQESIKRGWHGNRLNFTVENLRLPLFSPNIFQLSHYSSKEFHKENPSKTHYWQWEYLWLRKFVWLGRYF